MVRITNNRATCAGSLAKRLPASFTSLSAQDKATLSLVGILVTEQTGKVKELLERMGIQAKGLDPIQVAQATLSALSKGDKKLNYELSVLICTHLLNTEENGGTYSHFDFKSLLGKIGAAGVPIAADPVSAVAGAVGNVASAIGQNKQARREAGAQTTQNILAYHAQKTAGKGKKAGIKKEWIIAIVLLVGITVLVVVNLNGRQGALITKKI